MQKLLIKQAVCERCVLPIEAMEFSFEMSFFKYCLMSRIGSLACTKSHDTSQATFLQLVEAAGICRHRQKSQVSSPTSISLVPRRSEGRGGGEKKERLVSTACACATSGGIPPPPVPFVYIRVALSIFITQLAASVTFDEASHLPSNVSPVHQCAEKRYHVLRDMILAAQPTKRTFHCDARGYATSNNQGVI